MDTSDTVSMLLNISLLKTLLSMASLIVKLVMMLIFNLYLNHVEKKATHSSLKFIRIISFVLIGRDILFTAGNMLFPHLSTNISPIMFNAFADVAVVVLLLYWLSCFSGKKVHYSIFMINGILAIPFIIYIALNGHMLYMGNENGLKWFILVWLAFNWIYLAVHLYRISEFNSDNPEVIMKSRNALLFIGLMTIIVMYPAFFRNNHINFLIIQTLLAPLSYLIYYLILNNYDKFEDLKNKKEVEFIHNDVESLFEFMRVMGSAMADKISIDEILKFISDNVVKTTKAKAGAILMIDDYEDILKVKAVSGFFPPLYGVPNIVKRKTDSLNAYFESTPIRVGETVLGEAVKTGDAIFIKNTFNDNRMKANTYNDTLFVSSAIIIPLVISKRVLGVLAVIHKEQGKYFSESDFSHLKTFAEYASLNIDFVMTYMELLEKREMEREISVAADIQNKLLPKKLPRLKHAVLEAYSIPAKGVSGDYYDVLQLKNEKMALVICDVAGKGVPAAMVMVMIRSILHLVAAGDREVSTILTWVNRGISGQIDIDHYATMSILFYNQTTRELTYTNAAHHPLLIIRSKTKTTETIDTEGLPIGIEKTTKYGQKKARLHPGDVIVMYTDGIIEAMNLKGEQYTTERFTELVLENSHLTPKEIIKIIKADLAAFVGNAKQHDDQTLLLMKV